MTKTKKRVLAILMAFSFCVVVPAVSPTIVAAADGPCADLEWQNYHMGNSQKGVDGYVGVKGVYSEINPGDWDTCYSSVYDDDKGEAAWVGIQPNPGFNTGSYGSGAIIQIGVIRCTIDTDDLSGFPPGTLHMCDARAGELVYFWASGGCNGLGAYPVYIGQADGGNHSYRIQQLSDGRFEMKIDEVVKYTIPASWTRTDCWDGSHNMAVADAERFDRGDGLGTSASKTVFQNIRFINNDTSLNWEDWRLNSANPCVPFNTPSGSPGESCDITHADSFSAWTP